LLRLLEALNIAHAVLVGSSLGAAIAIDFTLENPAMVRSLVLVSPGLGGYDWQPSIERYGAAILEAARADDTDRIVEEHLRLWVDGRSRQPTSLAWLDPRASAGHAARSDHRRRRSPDGAPCDRTTV